MKKLLSILICVLLGVGLTTTFAQNTVTIHGYAIAEGVAGYGGGTITVTGKNATATQLNATDNWKDNKTVTGTNVETNAMEDTDKGWLSGKTYYTGIKVKLNATADSENGFYFAGFAQSNTLTPSIFPTSLPWTSDEIPYGSTTSLNYYAIFKRIISVSSVDDISVWTENSSIQSDPANVVTKAHGAAEGSTMTITLIDDDNFADDLDPTDFYLSDASGASIASGGTVAYSASGECFTFKVGYIGDAALENLEDKYVSVKLSFSTDEKIVHIKLSPLPSVTFKGTNGKGKYSATVLADFDTNSNDTKTVQLDNTTLKGITLTLETDPTDNQIFFGWKVTHLDGTTSLLGNTLSETHDFSNGDIIEPLFVPNTCGYMVMQDKGEPKTEWSGLTDGFFITYWKYNMTHKSMSYDLQEALNNASYGQFVVFENLATIFSKFNITRPSGFEQPSNAAEAILPSRDGGYTIPEGVTLLIPASADYAYGMDKSDVKCFPAESGLAPFRKLIVESGTQITVNGALCVFAYITSTSGVNGSPNACGILELQDGAHIIVNGKLYSNGYIINPATTQITNDNINNVGRITANSTAEVHETFQIADWRGGNATSGMLKNSRQVFPMNQYYIQNIEVPIKFRYGSTESLATAVEVTVAGTLIAEAKFILPDNVSEAGFFKMGDGTSVTKYYDAHNDRLCCIVDGNSLNSYAFIENVYLPISNYEVNSTDYVLAVTNNMDFILNNVTMKLKYDICFLPGSTLNINPNARLMVDGTETNHASVFVYDFEWSSQDGIGTQGNQQGYFAPENATIKLLTKRPGGFKEPRRTISEDASIIVNGIMEIGQYGELYTTAAGTAEGTNWSLSSYGANIISTGNGRVKFNRIGTATVTYQAHQHVPDADNSNNNYIDYYLDIPVSSAQLKNANGTYKATTLSDQGKIFVYKDGEWQEPNWILPTFETTLPTRVFDGEAVQLQISTPDKDQNPWVITLEGEGFTIDGEKKTTSVTYNASMGDYITFPIHYTVQNKNGTHSANITVTHNSDTYTTTINAIENYKPIFSTTPTPPEVLNLGEMFIGDHSIPVGLVVIPTTGNVTSLITNATYVSRLSWDVVYNSNTTEFQFEFGEGKKALSDAKITFTPTSSGQKEATIKLRATYQDANDVAVVSDEVTLQVTAFAKDLLLNAFALTTDCQNELKDMCVGIPVTLEFKDLTTNTQPLNIQFTNNGIVGSEVLILSVDKPYTITATSVPAEMPTITISQESDGTYAAHTTEAYATSIANCLPEVQWNWSDLYFGEGFTTPVVSNSDGQVTLTLTRLETKAGTEITDNAEIQEIINYNSTEKTATIGEDLEGKYIATFSFEQSQGTSHSPYSETFTSAIYARPNVLDLCVESERVFKGVQSGSSSASFEEDNKVVFPNDAKWTMRFVGVPDILSFTPTANTQLQVQESANGSSWGTAYYAQVYADMRYDVELLPSTRYLRFTVVQSTALQGICISKLNRVKANADILYMPIAADPDNAPTTRTITFTYTSDKDLDIRFSTDEFSSVPEKLTKTAAGEYGQVTVTVTSKATTEQDARLTIQEPHQAGQVADIKLEIPIETYRFPQRLPIQLEAGKDPAKRFYYITTAYKDVEWDATTYSVNLKKQTNDVNDNPYITFAFDGAPSFISFVPLVDAENWKIEESTDGTFGGEYSLPTIADGVLKQTLQYTSRFVRVTYIGTKMDAVKMTKVNIMSDQGAVPNPEELNLTEKNKYTVELSVGADLQVTTVNLTNMTIETDNSNFTLSYDSENPAQTFILDNSKIDKVFGPDVVGAIPFKVFWNAAKVSDFGNIIITTKIDEEIKTLATIPLVGNAGSIVSADVFYTGVPEGYTLAGSFSGIYAIDGNDGTSHRPVNLSNTYDAEGNALFDILVIYGETTTTDGTNIITTPNGTLGSNAKTPVFIYYCEGNAYKFAMMEENANAANKLMDYWTVEKKDLDQPTRIYMTGFCPYASTGYTKEDEGVWYFQGVNGAKLDIYLDDCYIYSRNKTPEGRPFNGRYDGQAFSEPYVRGSGAVLVFENQDNDKNGSFDVTIHTINHNMFKSNYGCFFELMKGMRAFQVSSPIQVHLASDTHKANSVTTITFDDKWPKNAAYSEFKRTNGFLSLQKQHNNAPSIDLGNANTIVNFDGGQVELQNASIVSLNYKTTLAISFRSGLMAGFPMAYGIGTDDVGGRVNFKDGTTTVIPMDVDPKFKDFYLLDVDATGKPITTGEGANLKYRTSCLRCPTNTVVTGGSHCMLRACEDVTSKGGAPVDENGELVGIYKYPKIKSGTALGGFGEPNSVGLVVPTDELPGGYAANSVTPNTNATTDPSDDFLNFWFTTEEESTVKPEVDKTISFWKACMTEIAAEYMSYGGRVGGDTKIFPNEEIKYLLYCQLDENISNVITAGTGTDEDKVFTYQAPVKDPTGQLATDYLTITPSYVGDEWQNYIETAKKVTVDDEETTVNIGDDYTVTDKVYYVVPATADTWMTFTAPFNVEKLWIVETYEESALEATPLKKLETEEGAPEVFLNKRQSVLLEQAKHNADFAAFFGVAMALGREQTFDEIYRDYIGWAMFKDNHTGGASTYTKRGKVQLQHYDGSNFSTAHYYLYKNNANWELKNDGNYQTAWEVVGKVGEGDVLMQQGETYSLLFPYCTGCDVQKDEHGNIIKDENGLPKLAYTRDYWDYWSGKFLIFESTTATGENPHKIKGSDYHNALFDPAKSVSGNSAILTGNSTFALMYTDESVDSKIYTYTPTMGRECFENGSIDDGYGNITYQEIQPTVAFLITDIPSQSGMPARKISRTGEIIYDKENTPTGNLGGNIPTIGGGNDLFVTSIAGGINIAVAAPQQVRVISSTGAVLYSGMVQTSVDVAIPTTGVYVVTGENEAQKILY